MGLFGKSEEKRKKDAEKLKKCIETFNDEIKKINFDDKENFDKVTYEKFSSAYNTAFSDYINNKDKKRFSHTNDVLKEISKKIEKFEDKLILKQTYKQYCDCYRYNPKKRKKDAAIDEVKNEYSNVVNQLENKLKLIAKSRAYLDIKISDKEFDEASKQETLFEKFKGFESALDSLELNGYYVQISEIFRNVFDDNIKGKGKWFSHTNDVFKAINKKLKKFDEQVIDGKTYKDYLECFKYDPKKLSKKAAIDDKRLFNSYQKLCEKILTKLKNYIKGVDENDLIAFEDAIDEFKKEVTAHIGDIDGCDDFETYLKNHFSEIYYDQENKKNIYSLFENFIKFKYYFFDPRVTPDFYTDKLFYPKSCGKEKLNLYNNLINFIEAKIKERVKGIEDGLDRKVELEINSSDIDFNKLGNILYKSYNKVGLSMQWSVITDLTLKVSKDFSICTSSNSTFNGIWSISKQKYAPKLEKIKIEGTTQNVTLTKIGGKLFEGIPNLKSIEFENVGFDKDIDLTELKNLLGVGTGVTIKIDGKELNVFIKQKEEKEKKNN